MKKNRNPERTKTLKEKGKIPFRYRFFLGGASFFLALMILVTGVAFAFRETIDLYLSGSRTNVSKEAKEKAAYNSRRLAAQIEAEGAVLLKNENNTLPLSEDHPGKCIWLGIHPVAGKRFRFRKSGKSRPGSFRSIKRSGNLL